MPDAGDGVGCVPGLPASRTRDGQGKRRRSSARGDPLGDRRRGTATEGSVRPESWSQDGAVRDAARPGSYVGNVPGCCEGSGQPGRPHRRPALGESATQPRDGCAVDMRDRPGRRAHSDQSLPRTRYGGVRGAEAQRRIAQDVPSSETASEEQCSTPRPTHAAGRRLSLMDRHRESRARSVGTLRVRDGPSRFLGTKRWKKPETASIITRTSERMEDFRGGLGPARPKSLAT